VTALYIYAVLRSEHPDPRDTPGVGDDSSPVRLVRRGQVAAAVSDAPEPLVGRRRDLLSHSRVVEHLWGQGPVLPMRFGIVAPDEASLRADVLDDPTGRLLSRLSYLTDRVEMSIKAWHHEETVLREVVQEHREVAALQARIRRGGTYNDRIRLGELVAGAVEAKQAVDGERLLRQLTPAAVEVRPGAPVDGALLNAAFLVDRNGIEEFGIATSRIEELEGERLTVRAAGPLPPYSFVEGEEPAASRSTPPRHRSREAVAGRRGRR
jgi:hypothetical protein